MTPANESAVLALLAAQTNLLVEIRDLLRDVLMDAKEDPLDPFAGCQHPEAARVDVSTPGDRDHWLCRVCQFDNKSVA